MPAIVLPGKKPGWICQRGLEYEHIQAAYQLAQTGKINLNSSVAAVGGMLADSEAIQAAEARLFLEKTIIYSQLEDLPLLGIRELAEKHPEFKSKMGEQNLWTREAEAELFELSGK